MVGAYLVDRFVKLGSSELSQVVDHRSLLFIVLKIIFCPKISLFFLLLGEQVKNLEYVKGDVLHFHGVVALCLNVVFEAVVLQEIWDNYFALSFAFEVQGNPDGHEHLFAGVKRPEYSLLSEWLYRLTLMRVTLGLWNSTLINISSLPTKN